MGLELYLLFINAHYTLELYLLQLVEITVTMRYLYPKFTDEENKSLNEAKLFKLMSEELKLKS